METPTKTVTVSPESFGAMSRYIDAYRVGNGVITAGQTIKVIGGILGILIIVFSVVVASSGRDTLDRNTGILGVVIGVVIGILIYFFGVLIAALGQILLASLDVAVCTSPFLSDEQRAKVMSLAQTEKVRFKMEAAERNEAAEKEKPKWSWGW